MSEVSVWLRHEAPGFCCLVPLTHEAKNWLLEHANAKSYQWRAGALYFDSTDLAHQVAEGLAADDHKVEVVRPKFRSKVKIEQIDRDDECSDSFCPCGCKQPAHMYVARCGDLTLDGYVDAAPSCARLALVDEGILVDYRGYQIVKTSDEPLYSCEHLENLPLAEVQRYVDGFVQDEAAECASESAAAQRTEEWAHGRPD